MIFQFYLGDLSGEGAYIMQFLFGIDAKKGKKQIIIKKQWKSEHMPEINIEPRLDMVRCVHLNIISNERTDIVQ